MKEGLIAELQVSRKFFLTSIDCLEEKDSSYAPKEGIFTVAQQVAHTAQVVDWFFDGTFAENGFDMNFEALEANIRKCSSLKEALDTLNKAYDKAVEVVQEKPEDVWMQPFPADSPIMANMPKVAIISSITDHTAHHRGALTVYSRLLGKTPKMPYAE